MNWFTEYWPFILIALAVLAILSSFFFLAGNKEEAQHHEDYINNRNEIHTASCEANKAMNNIIGKDKK